MWLLFFAVYMLAAIPPRELLLEVVTLALVATLLVAIAFSEFLAFNPYMLIDPRRHLRFLVFNIKYAIAMTVSHLAIARAVVDPRVEVTAAILPVRVKASDRVSVALAHLITNTPGTLVVDLKRDGEDCILYVHWLNPETLDEKEAKEKIVGWLEPSVREVLE